MTEHFTPTGRMPSMPEFVGLFVDGDLEPQQKDMLQRLMDDVDFSEVEKRIITHGCCSYTVGIDLANQAGAIAAVLAGRKRNGEVIILHSRFGNALEVTIQELNSMFQQPEPEVKIQGHDPVFMIYDDIGRDEHLRPVKAVDEPDQRPFAKKTQRTNKPLPYYHGTKRRF